MSHQLTRMFGENAFGNLWNNAEVEHDGTSNEVDIEHFPHISIMINIYSDEANETEQNATINFEASPDGEHWTFCGQITENLPQGGKSKAHIFETVGTKYIRLVRDDDAADDNVFINATVQAKG